MKKNCFSLANAKKKLASILTLTLVLVPTAALISCDNTVWIPITTTADGYKIIEWPQSWIYTPKGEVATLIEFPQEEIITIPEKLEGRKFTKIGHYFENKEEFKNTLLLRPDNDYVKTLIFNREIIVKYAKLSNLETLEYSNPLNWIYSKNINKVIDPYEEFFHNDFIAPSMKNISISQETFDANGTEIWLYINTIRDTQSSIHSQEYNFIIPSGTFSASSLVIGTDRQTPQDTWGTGWNGSNRVIWGVDKNEFFTMRMEENNV